MTAAVRRSAADENLDPTDHAPQIRFLKRRRRAANADRVWNPRVLDLKRGRHPAVSEFHAGDRVVAGETGLDVLAGVGSEAFLFEEDRADAAAHVRRGSPVVEAPASQHRDRHQADGVRNTETEYFAIDDQHSLARLRVAIDRSAEEETADPHLGAAAHDGAAAGPGDRLEAVLRCKPRVAELAEARVP